MPLAVADADFIVFGVDLNGAALLFAPGFEEEQGLLPGRIGYPEE